LLALGRVARRYLTECEWHIVFYTWMGLFPQTREGAEAIVRASAKIARQGGAQRLVVKTAAEAKRIPTIEENLEALDWARKTADMTAIQLPALAVRWAET